LQTTDISMHSCFSKSL